MKRVLTLSKLASCVALAIVATACGDDVLPESVGDSTPGETIADVEAEPQDTEASASTTAVTEPAPPETTIPVEPTASDVDAVTVVPEPVQEPEPTLTPGASSRADFVLRANGVGSADFGQADIDVIPVMTELLGNPVDDRLGEYPLFDEDYSLYIDFEDSGFSAPFGRTTCYDNEFCLYFGGGTGDDLRFVGWSQDGFDLASDPLASDAGVTIGSRYADHLGEMTVGEGGCFTQGFGEIAGITLFLTSEGVPFVSFDDDGTFVAGTPDPTEIVVTGMEAGDRPFFVFADC